MYTSIFKKIIYIKARWKWGFRVHLNTEITTQACTVQEYLLYTQFLDLNPIKNLWDELNRRIRTTTITSKEILKQRLKEEWNNIPTEYLKNNN